MAAKRFRLKFMFWLDLSKSDEADLADDIAILKEQRLFSQTLRDGIRLICQLRAGRTDLLFELFPWLAAEMNRPDESLDLVIRQEIDRLSHLIASQQGSRVVDANPALPGLQKAKANGFSSPADADDDIKLSIKAAKNGSSGKNFLSSLMSLQQ